MKLNSLRGHKVIVGTINHVPTITISRKIIPYLFLLPSLLGLFLFRFYPVIFSFYKSLYRTSFSSPGGTSVFTGLSNYIDLFHDPTFWNSLKVTFKLNLFLNPIQITMALIVALLIRKNTLFNRISRTLFLIPLGASIVVSSSIWKILLNPNYGLINGILEFLSVPQQPFLTSLNQAIWCIILLASWCGIPYLMIFFLVGLQEIPKELYEAAKIDGSNNWNTFWKITLPLLKRTILFVTVVDTSANFLLFVPIWMLTLGGPRMSTDVLMYQIYSSAFIYSDLPRALSMSAVLLIIMLIIIFFEFGMLSKEAV
jgi:ABC-type sugar transport system permease subunit